MRESRVQRLILFLGFILPPAGIFRLYIKIRETHKSSCKFFRCSLQEVLGFGGGGEDVLAIPE